VYAQAQWTSRPPRAGKLSRRLRGQLTLFDFARRPPRRVNSQQTNLSDPIRTHGRPRKLSGEFRPKMVGFAESVVF
jgi:hypothetical protein